MKILDKPVSKKDLLKNSEAVFDECMIKGVVDINKGLLAIDAQLHAEITVAGGWRALKLGKK